MGFLNRQTPVPAGTDPKPNAILYKHISVIKRSHGDQLGVELRVHYGTLQYYKIYSVNDSSFQIKAKLRAQGMSDTVKLSWKVQPDEDIFHKKEMGKSPKKRRKRSEL